MKFLKPLFVPFILLFVFTNATQCKSAKKNAEAKKMVIETQSEIQTGQVYFQKWVAGRQEADSGINIYFPNLTNKNNYPLKQVFFRGMIGEMRSGKASYFANLTYNKKDIIMSNEPNAEYGNTLPNSSEDFPFTLKDNECIISYIDDGKIKYHKIGNIVEKQAQYLPSAPPKQNKE